MKEMQRADKAKRLHAERLAADAAAAAKQAQEERETEEQRFRDRVSSMKDKLSECLDNEAIQDWAYSNSSCTFDAGLPVEPFCLSGIGASSSGFGIVREGEAASECQRVSVSEAGKLQSDGDGS